MKTTPVRKRDLEGRLAGSGGGPANRAAPDMAGVPTL